MVFNQKLYGQMCEYKNYIQSKAWALLKETRLKKDNNQCVLCKSKEKLFCHHITYIRLYLEKINDLITLCSHCHKRIHASSPPKSVPEFIPRSVDFIKPNAEEVQIEIDKLNGKQTGIYEGVPEDIFVKVLRKSTKVHHKICFILAYGSGLKISEITKLTKNDFDIKQRRIIIGNRITLLSKHFKKGFLKNLPIKIGERAIGKTFLNKIKPYNKIIYIDEAGRPRYKYSFHSLRDSFAVNCLKEKIPIHILQLMLGHKNLKTTSKYVHQIGEHGAETIARRLIIS